MILFTVVWILLNSSFLVLTVSIRYSFRSYSVLPLFKNKLLCLLHLNGDISLYLIRLNNDTPFGTPDIS